MFTVLSRVSGRTFLKVFFCTAIESISFNNNIRSILGCYRDIIPFNYLGVLIFFYVSKM